MKEKIIKTMVKSETFETKFVFEDEQMSRDDLVALAMTSAIIETQRVFRNIGEVPREFIYPKDIKKTKVSRALKALRGLGLSADEVFQILER